MTHRIRVGIGVLLLLVFGATGHRFYRFLQTQTLTIGDYSRTSGGKTGKD